MTRSTSSQAISSSDRGGCLPRKRGRRHLSTGGPAYHRPYRDPLRGFRPVPPSWQGRPDRIRGHGRNVRRGERPNCCHMWPAEDGVSVPAGYARPNGFHWNFTKTARLNAASGWQGRLLAGEMDHIVVGSCIVDDPGHQIHDPAGFSLRSLALEERMGGNKVIKRGCVTAFARQRMQHA